jgi:hypothetical protein
MNPMLKAAINLVVKEVLEVVLTDENKQEYGDRLFDFIEDVVADSETAIDDRIVLPIVARLREMLDIPDDPDIVVGEMLDENDDWTCTCPPDANVCDCEGDYSS